MKRRRNLGNVKIPKPELAPYGLGDGVCSPLPGRSTQVCLKRVGKPGPAVNSPEDVCRLLKAAKDADRESLYAIHLDVKNRPLAVEEVSRGALDGVLVTPREVFKSAILSNAAAVILAHNHPSGSPEPSNADYGTTTIMAQAGKMIGIPLRDHVIVADGGCTSLRERMGSRAEFGGAIPRRRKRR
jgi:DNA repair protein RadC